MAARPFKSLDHPGHRLWPAVYGLSLVQPLAACMLPVMILTLVGVLEGMPILPYALWAAGAAVALASAWTSFQMRRKLAEIVVDDEWVRTRSIWDVARGRSAPSMRVLDVRDYGSWALITVGLTSHTVERQDWSEYDSLVSALIAARELGRR